MLDIETSWSIFLNAAKQYENLREPIYSPGIRVEYRITSTKNDVVRIKRISVENSFETIGLYKFKTCINRINKAFPIIKKGSIYEHVVEEATIVELLPMLRWNENGRHVLIAANIIENISSNDLPEARNEDFNKKVLAEIRVRNQQAKMKDKLMRVYDKQCAISGCTVSEVLIACHITPYSLSAINISTNGLLLRSDIHVLYDRNLLAINPDSFKIKVHRKLLGTDYYAQFNDKKLRERNDGKAPNLEALYVRWEKFHKH